MRIRQRFMQGSMIIITASILLCLSLSAKAQSDMEEIGRGLVGVKGATGIYVGWRLLGTEPDSTGFNLYRITDGGAAEKLNIEPLKGATNFFDATAVLTSENKYFVKSVSGGLEKESSDTVGTWNQNYLNVPLQKPAGGSLPDGDYTYTANDASVADLDGDGEYEVILKWDPTNSHDNAHDGYTGNMILDAYEMDGTLIWRIDVGINVRSGAHYTPFIVYDLDQDGKAEVAIRTAPGSKDASGSFISDGPAATADHNADYRTTTDRIGRILSGPEYLTVFNGPDGTELATIDLEPARGSLGSWGDTYGNRAYRFTAAVAYLDGQKPSLLWCRGIYEKMEIAAFDWNGSDLNLIWHFKTQEGYSDWAGMGSHNLSVGDVDLDGRDELVYGNCAIDDDGTGLWTLRGSIGKATGDAMHLADIVPEREGLEKWGCGEGSGPGSHLVDAGTGEPLWLTAPGDVGRATAGDLVAGSYGMECWGGTDGLRSATNVRVGSTPSSTNHVVWWDADLGRELLNGTDIRKYPSGTLQVASGCSSNNGTKSNPSLQADIFGDWREEVIWRTSDNNNLRIYTTTDVTEYRIKTLMHDRQYRLSIAWQNVSYNQPPHTSFYLGFDMFKPIEEIPPAAPSGLVYTNIGTDFIDLSWTENFETDLSGYNLYKSIQNRDYMLLNDSVISATMFRDTVVFLDTSYRYYVTAVDTFGNESLPSSTLSALPTYKPNPPDMIKGRSGYRQNLVFWNQAVGRSESDTIIGYNIYASQTSGSGFQKLNTEMITDTTYLHIPLLNGSTYYYLVKSIDDSDRESFNPEELIVTTGQPYLIQSEDADLENIFVEDEHIGYHGWAYTNFDAEGFVEFKYVYSRYGGWYNMVVRYALGNESRTGMLHVNDESIPFTMEGTGEWTNYVYDTVKVNLKPDFDNVIRFEATGSDFGNLDEIIIDDQTTGPGLAIAELKGNQDLFFYPNPFNSFTQMDLKYSGSARPTIRIMNIFGQVVKVAEFESQGGELYTFRWDGTGDGRSQVSQGVYLATIFLGDDGFKTVKIMLKK